MFWLGAEKVSASSHGKKNFRASSSSSEYSIKNAMHNGAKIFMNLLLNYYTVVLVQELYTIQ
jgi:hypothetical protein